MPVVPVSRSLWLNGTFLSCFVNKPLLCLIFILSVYVTGTRRINQHLSFHVTVNVSCPPQSAPTPFPLAARWPQHSSNQQISTVTLMSEIAYEGNLFPMVGPMINAHWQRVFPPGALLGCSSCVTPPPPQCPPSPTSHKERDEVEMVPRVYAEHYTTTRLRWSHRETTLAFAFLLDHWRSGKHSERLKLANWLKPPDEGS